MIAPHVHIPFDQLSAHLDLIRERSLNLEIYFSGDVLDALTPADVKRAKNELNYKPSLSFHAPFMDLSPGAVDSLVRDATLRRISHILDIAEILKPKVIVFHSGYEKWRYALKADWWLEKSLLTWRPVQKRAAEMNVKIAIENIFEDEPSSLKMLMDGVSAANFGICFDTGHFNLFSRVRLEDWMEALNPHILEIHLHDNDKTSDQHLPVGDGTFDFGKFFYLLNNRNCIHTIEAHSPEKVLRSFENIRRFTRSSAGS
ncbi:MAG TPA: sugar phosphate isomerase/epimerase family protein [Thermodesulfovibrionales bacterium]|nr:sugar phosphate isomerase/epimerase family protein [Thermodesulfovibrionales bacterium]